MSPFPRRLWDKLQALLSHHRDKQIIFDLGPASFSGRSGGAYGSGPRTSFELPCVIINATHDGSRAKAPTQTDPERGLDVATECANLPNEILVPRNKWADNDGVDAAAARLARPFTDNFQTNADVASADPEAATYLVTQPKNWAVQKASAGVEA